MKLAFSHTPPPAPPPFGWWCPLFPNFLHSGGRPPLRRIRPAASCHSWLLLRPFSFNFCFSQVLSFLLSLYSLASPLRTFLCRSYVNFFFFYFFRHSISQDPPPKTPFMVGPFYPPSRHSCMPAFFSFSWWLCSEIKDPPPPLRTAFHLCFSPSMSFWCGVRGSLPVVKRVGHTWFHATYAPF